MCTWLTLWLHDLLLWSINYCSLAACLMTMILICVTATLLADLVGCCSCQDFSLDDEACCSCLWFFPYLCQIVAKKRSNDHVGQDVSTWRYVMCLSDLDLICMCSYDVLICRDNLTHVLLLLLLFAPLVLMCDMVCNLWWCATCATWRSHLVSSFSQNFPNGEIVVLCDWLY